MSSVSCQSADTNITTSGLCTWIIKVRSPNQANIYTRSIPLPPLVSAWRSLPAGTTEMTPFADDSHCIRHLLLKLNAWDLPTPFSGVWFRPATVVLCVCFRLLTNRNQPRLQTEIRQCTKSRATSMYLVLCTTIHDRLVNGMTSDFDMVWILLNYFNPDRYCRSAIQPQRGGGGQQKIGNNKWQKFVSVLVFTGQTYPSRAHTWNSTSPQLLQSLLC